MNCSGSCCAHAGILLAAILALSAGCEKKDEKLAPQDLGDNNPNLCVAVGDSITAGSELAATPWPARLAALTGKQVVNLGVPGQKAVSAVGQVSAAAAAYKPGYLLILYGANDVIGRVDPLAIAGSIRAMVQAARANQCVPVVATLTPMIGVHAVFQGGVSALNPWIRKLAAEEGAILVDLEAEFGDGEGLFNADGLHPNDAGTQLIALAFADAVD